MNLAQEQAAAYQLLRTNVAHRPLGEVCQINPRLPKDARPDSGTQVTFVPMAVVDEETGTIQAPGVRPYSEVAKGYTHFVDGDVLFAKITPCMENGKAAIATNLVNGLGFGSTEFHVLRPEPEVLPEWVFYFVRRESFRRQAKASFTGSAGQQRVSKQFIETVQIPVPALSEQHRIVDILKRADGIRRLRKQAQDTARQLIPALFIEMFGDPTTNPKGWDVATFADVGTLDRGKSKHRPRNDPILFGGPFPFIQTGDVANSKGVIRQFTATYSEVGLQQSRLWSAGTLCITIAANIADTATLGFDACFPDSVVGFIPNSMVTTEYVQYWLSFLKPVLETSAPQLAQKNINLKILRSLPIMVPPIDLQNEFVARLENIQSITVQQDAAQGGAESIFQSLLHRTFSGRA